MSRNVPDGTGPAPEIWHLTHPAHGTFEVAVGGPVELRTVDAGYPQRTKDDGKSNNDNDNDNDDNDDDEARTVANPGYVMILDGTVIARGRQIGDHKVSISGDPPEPGKHTTSVSAVQGPRIQMRSSAFATAVRQVTFRDGKEVVHFDPPPGSAAEARLEAIASSPWKRVVYPVAGGIGKSGWAIAMIIFLPLLGRVIEPVIDWIAERIPDVDIPWPDVSLPEIPWPDIDLPSINLPEIAVPGWVELLLEYSKVWVPLLIGIAVAVVTVRHARRSRRTKQAWREGRSEDRADDGPDEHFR